MPQRFFHAAGPRLPASPCLLAVVCLGVLAAACSSGSPAGVPLALTLDHRLGDAPLELHHAQPQAEGKDGAPSLTITRLSYYLGRFRLQQADGRWIESPRRADPEGDYQRVDAALPRTLRFTPLRVPAGDYTALEFLIGIDARRNHSGAQTGALDPQHGLMWTWKTGYIFFALEGRSPASGAPDGRLTFHLGGDDALARTVVLPLAMHIDADDASAPLNLRVDLAGFFRDLPLDRIHTVMSAQGAASLADRYADLFEVAPPSSHGDAQEIAHAP